MCTYGAPPDLPKPNHTSRGGPMGAGGVRATHRYKFQYNHQAQLPPPPQPCLVPQGTKQQPRQGGGELCFMVVLRFAPMGCPRPPGVVGPG